ncbi:hypothetical protein B0H21DRAFT_216903 [Amylocystis lapponica]|nr:hypothetical protein B0H21DRAFT_216903 [Amylocystis lapponica]
MSPGREGIRLIRRLDACLSAGAVIDHPSRLISFDFCGNPPGTGMGVRRLLVLEPTVVLANLAFGNGLGFLPSTNFALSRSLCAPACSQQPHAHINSTLGSMDHPKKPRHRHSAFQLAAHDELYDQNEHPSLEDRLFWKHKLTVCLSGIIYGEPLRATRRTKEAR